MKNPLGSIFILSLLSALVVEAQQSPAASVPPSQVVTTAAPVTPADAKAFEALKVRAHQGAPGDQYALAESYFRGKGVARDLTQASLWYRKAAYQGHADSQYKTFVCLNLGLGVIADKYEALNWLRKAADQQHPRAHHSLGIVHEFGEAGVPKDLSAAVKYYQKGLELEDADSVRALATCYHNGTGVAMDMVRALELYHKAAGLGHPVAQVILAGFYLEGKGVARDPERAFVLSKQAAEAGIGRGQFTLGVLYYQGIGTPRDFAQAVVWYRRAVESGEPTALYNLGYCYVTGGEGVPRNTAEAYALWTLAVEYMPVAKDSLNRLTRSLSTAELTAGKARVDELRALIKSKRTESLLIGY